MRKEHTLPLTRRLSALKPKYHLPPKCSVRSYKWGGVGNSVFFSFKEMRRIFLLEFYLLFSWFSHIVLSFTSFASSGANFYQIPPRVADWRFSPQRALCVVCLWGRLGRCMLLSGIIRVLSMRPHAHLCALGACTRVVLPDNYLLQQHTNTPPPEAQEPAMFCRRTSGCFLDCVLKPVRALLMAVKIFSGTFHRGGVCLFLLRV